MAGNYEHLRRTEEGPVATVALARPEARNALNAALIYELTRCFAELRVSEEGRDGLAAFLEEREPRWRSP
ncbi:MAG: hypothetical protein ACJ73Y_05605 [Rubrobacteraceae bacterium]|jgi:1,4-dihydroxy-2-naphthoyl-CoA synthase